MTPTTLPSAGVLVLRVVVGVTFVLHGLDKLGDLSSAEQFFASLDIPAPGLTAPAVAVTEIVGGVLLIAGLATPLVGAALAIDMLVALLTAHLGHGFFAVTAASSSRCCSAAPASASASRVPGASAWTPRSSVGGLKGPRLGSTSRAVANRAPCPVLVARRSAFAE